MGHANIASLSDEKGNNFYYEGGLEYVYPGNLAAGFGGFTLHAKSSNSLTLKFKARDFTIKGPDIGSNFALSFPFIVVHAKSKNLQSSELSLTNINVGNPK